jgi:hypothetical protein
VGPGTGKLCPEAWQNAHPVAPTARLAHVPEGRGVMSMKFAYGTAACVVLAAAVIFAAVPQSFVPDWTFHGSDLKGWHVLGQAEWHAVQGELIGKPTSEAGGWLVLDKSYQDVQFFASFRCSGDCKTGVLLRAQKTANGMQGLYVSLTQGDVVTYRVSLDAQGRELSREKLAPAAGNIRYAKDFKAPEGANMFDRPAPAFDREKWNPVEIVLDADIIRPYLGQPKKMPGQDEFWPFLTLMIPGGATGDDMTGYGPVAIYAGGTGEAHFKDVALKDLMAKTEPAERISSHFRMQRISDFYYSWGVDVADINHDGIPDIVAPPFYYLGPNFTERREFMPGHTFNVSNEYTEHMVVSARDFTGDGWPDIITTFTNGQPLYLYVNPRGQSRRWERYTVVPAVGSEIALLYDLHGDGTPDFIYRDRERGFEYATPDKANPTGPWKITNISGPLSGYNPHGLGVGDINGDGRLDILAPEGWWEQPPKGSQADKWTFHPAKFGWGAGEMCVYDVNGDGLNDVVTPMFAHGLGISWFEQKRDASGKISFVEHPVMGDYSTRNAGNVTFSEQHASVCADLDGDGIPDLIVGKRLFSHEESYLDPDPYGTSVLYWYRTVRNPKAPGGAEFVPELIHNRSGVGSQFVAVDVNKDGAPDIITSVNRGTFIFFNKLHTSDAKPAPKQ